jgi:hypothetical protein
VTITRKGMIAALFVIALALTSYMVFSANSQADTTIIDDQPGLIGSVASIASGASPERASPGDWVKEDKIFVYNDRVVIYLDNPEWAKFTDTNSMDPLFDAESNALEIVPASPDVLKVGDIIAYQIPEGTVIHRIVRIGTDDSGWYAIVKGDNNPGADPDKVRWEQVRRVLVAIIY